MQKLFTLAQKSIEFTLLLHYLNSLILKGWLTRIKYHGLTFVSNTRERKLKERNVYIVQVYMPIKEN